MDFHFASFEASHKESAESHRHESNIRDASDIPGIALASTHEMTMIPP
jgi:hypothetical protein